MNRPTLQLIALLILWMSIVWNAVAWAPVVGWWPTWLAIAVPAASGLLWLLIVEVSAAWRTTADLLDLKADGSYLIGDDSHNPGQDE